MIALCLPGGSTIFSRGLRFVVAFSFHDVIILYFVHAINYVLLWLCFS